MDINETGKNMLYRHPWELSRTGCLLNTYSPVIDRLHRGRSACRYINVGAGDLYFDKWLLERYPKDEVYAVDIGYGEETDAEQNIHKFRYLEEIEKTDFDYCIMMDSLEYMEDDTAYVKKMAEKLKKNGYFFLTLPADPSLFSEHDRIVGNLRRYSRKSFNEMIKKIPELKIVGQYNFYTSLYLVRFLQKNLHMRIDPEHKVTTGWMHPENSFLTKMVTGCLNFDFCLNRTLAGLGIRLPGLSMLVICKKI